MIYYQNRTDVPPLIRIQQFTFHLGFMGILRVPRHIRGVHLDNMEITIPPRGQKPANPPPPPPPEAGTRKKPLPQIVVDQIVCDETTLLILPKQEGKKPLDFDIHDLLLKSVGASKPFSFHGNLRNAKPVGEIKTKGDFGPWQVDDPGSTPVDGTYTFTDAKLDPFPGIGGTLSSTGKYSGVLGSLEVQGETDTPGFSLDPVGRPVPLHTEFNATVDGTNGDTYLHPVRATLIHSVIIANGSVVRVPEKDGHLIVLDAVAPKARLEDLLQLSTKSTKPMMSGLVNLKTKIVLPPGKVKVLDKLTLDGEFTVTDARFASSDVRDKLASFSRHAQGQPDNPDAGSAISDLRGKISVEEWNHHFSKPYLQRARRGDQARRNLHDSRRRTRFQRRAAHGGETFAAGKREEVVFPEGYRPVFQQAWRRHVSSHRYFRDARQPHAGIQYLPQKGAQKFWR